MILTAGPVENHTHSLYVHSVCSTGCWYRTLLSLLPHLSLLSPHPHSPSSLTYTSLHRKMGREPGRFDHVPRDVTCVVLCVVLIIELLPTQSASKLQTIIAGVLDVTGTYGSAVLPFKLLIGYDKFSFYQGIVAPGLFSSTGARDGRLVDAQSMSKC